MCSTHCNGMSLTSQEAYFRSFIKSESYSTKPRWTNSPKSVFFFSVWLLDVVEGTNPTHTSSCCHYIRAVRATLSYRPGHLPLRVACLLPVSAFLRSVFGGCSAKYCILLIAFLLAQPQMPYRRQQNNYIRTALFAKHI